MAKGPSPIERVFHDDYVDKKEKISIPVMFGQIRVSTNVIHVSKR